jgi:hypothetical protein
LLQTAGLRSGFVGFIYSFPVIPLLSFICDLYREILDNLATTLQLGLVTKNSVETFLYMATPLFQSVVPYNRRIHVNLASIDTKESRGNLLKVAPENGMIVTRHVVLCS